LFAGETIDGIFQATVINLAFGFCLIRLFFRRSLQVRPGYHMFSEEEPLGIAGARFLQTRCPSCFPTDSVRTLK